MTTLAAAALVVLGLVVVRARNRLVRLRSRVEEARAQLDVQLARRHRLVPPLVDAARAAMAHERAALVALAEADATLGGPAAAVGRAETGLTGALREILPGPDGSTSALMLRLQEDLLSAENRVAFARQHHNDCVLLLNDAVLSLPQNLVARLCRVRPGEYLDLQLL